jgi:hypothetical protein
MNKKSAININQLSRNLSMSNSTSRFMSNTVLKGLQVPGVLSHQKSTNQLSQLKYMQEIKSTGQITKSVPSVGPVVNNMASQLKVEPLAIKHS